MAKRSRLEKKLSIVCQVLPKETTAKLEIEHEFKTLYKEYKDVSSQLEKKMKN